MFLDKIVASDLLIPIAKDSDGNFVKPADANKTASYFCPECGECVILRRGTKKRSHFAHKTSQCSQESVVHKAAKEMIQMVVLAWKAGLRPAPVFVCKCYRCHNKIESPIPDKVDAVALEVTLADGHRVDVGLLEKGITIAAIEVKVTHAVDVIKAGQISVPFIEVDGNEIIERPDRLVAIQDHFKRRLCRECIAKEQEARQKQRQIEAKITSLLKEINYQRLPELDSNNKYIVRLTTCWECGREIIVFAWFPFKIFTKQKPPEPIPKTIKWRYSNSHKDRYWANTCLYCNSLQGDYYLYCEPDGPFWGYGKKQILSDSDVCRRISDFMCPVIFDGPGVPD